ncbi:MAG: enolase C-terminal domain-like protein [Burkholderiaceae bacterium]
MLITRAQLYPLEVPMSRPIKMAGETLTHAHTLLLRLIDSQGREGWGEASAAPLMTGETLGSITASTEYLVSKLMGVQVAEPSGIAAMQERILYGNQSAKSCHETALMDLFAQHRGIPLYQLLAGDTPVNANARLEMLHMLASGDLEGEIEEACVLRSDGYRQWKIKVGTGNAANDVRRVRAICAALQGDVVSADANQGLSVADAAAIAAAGRASGLSFLEQPFRTDMMDAMVALHRNTGLALCADESIQDLRDIAAHGAARAAQGVSLKLIKLGGTQALLAAGRLCLARGMRVNLACKVAETTISAAATAHAGFALGDVAWGFSMSNRYLAQDVCEQPLAPIKGVVTVDQMNRPGLGYAPDAARLREFASSTLPMREFRV